MTTLNTAAEIFGVKFERETEKAIQFTAAVCWGNGSSHARSFWAPKSQVKSRTETSILLSDWFYTKLINDNAFNGYQMQFCNEVEK